MQKHEFTVKLSDGQFWLVCEDGRGPYDDSEINWEGFDELANGFRWGVVYKENKQRKWRTSSQVTLSILALLDSVKIRLNNGQSVQCLTPDVKVVFYKD